MLFVTESLLTQNGAKILGCRIVDFVGTPIEFLREYYPYEFENGLFTHSLFDGDDELYLSIFGRRLYVCRIKPDEESHFRSCYESFVLLNSKHRKCYEKFKNEKTSKG